MMLHHMQLFFSGALYHLPHAPPSEQARLDSRARVHRIVPSSKAAETGWRQG